ncbi:hypothetical protein ATANTOWER_024176 [Ataeniobius toweri]|uniref:Transposase n=1 Tax=Ataeniobius toweri TaxID=208326 RepID=A0ABU7A310_9TELE|nr:hypothetical protein [Ataeniobius toweri]
MRRKIRWNRAQSECTIRGLNENLGSEGLTLPTAWTIRRRTLVQQFLKNAAADDYSPTSRAPQERQGKTPTQAHTHTIETERLDIATKWNPLRSRVSQHL